MWFLYYFLSGFMIIIILIVYYQKVYLVRIDKTFMEDKDSFFSNVIYYSIILWFISVFSIAIYLK